MTTSSPTHHWLARRLHGRLYYGWVVIGIVMMANLVAFGASPVFGLFITPLEAEFGWERSMISRSLTLGTFLGALLAPLLGLLIDRLGTRMLMTVFGCLASALYIALGYVTEAWQFNLVFGCILALAWTGVGQIMGTIAVNRWFVRRRGRAMGMVMMGASGGALVFIPLCTWIISNAGWRVAYQMMSGATLLLISVPALLFMVSRPEQAGLTGHGELASPGAGEGAPGAAPAGGATNSGGESGWTLQQAMHTRTFWITGLGVMLGSFTVQGYFVHAVPHMEALGLGRATASAVWGTFFFTGVFAKLAWGFLTERIGVRRGLILLYLGEAAGLYLLLNATTPAAAYFYAVFNGIAHGPFLQLSAMVWADYFGRRHIGRIFGTVQPAIVVAASTGPWLAGYLFDLSGNYQLFFTLSIGISLGAVACFLLAKPPGPPPQEAR